MWGEEKNTTQRYLLSPPLSKEQVNKPKTITLYGLVNQFKLLGAKFNKTFSERNLTLLPLKNKKENSDENISGV